MLGYIKDSCEIFHHPSCVREKCSCCRGGGGERGYFIEHKDYAQGRKKITCVSSLV